MLFRLTKACAVLAFAVVSSVAALAGVSVSAPANGATVGSPVHFVASASSTHAITYMRIYEDGVSRYGAKTSSINTYILMASGKHTIVIQAWDSAGNVMRQTLYITVSGTTTTTSTSSGSTTSIPSGAKTFYNIDQMTGWENCDSCAGPNASGPTAPHYLTQWVSSPSMDGKSAHFYLGGSTAYADAIWWKQLGANSGVKHFVYDLYFYMKNTSAPLALEFDTNQTTGGRRYVMGTQCGLNYDKQWDVWDASMHWVKTGIPCTNVKAYAWNHLIEEYYRANGRVYYVSITLNGKKYYVNRNYSTRAVSANDINVAFQMDMNSKATDISAWVDKIKLTYW